MLVVDFSSAERTEDTLLKIEIAVELAQAVLGKAETYGEAAALEGVKTVFRALASRLAQPS